MPTDDTLTASAAREWFAGMLERDTTHAHECDEPDCEVCLATAIQKQARGRSRTPRSNDIPQAAALIKRLSQAVRDYAVDIGAEDCGCEEPDCDFCLAKALLEADRE